MANEGKKRKFISSLTFKLLVMILILFGFGLFYNFVIAEDDVVSEQEQQEEQQRNAVLDTVDVVGDYLWPNRKSRKRDLTTNEENVKSNSETKKNNEETHNGKQKKRIKKMLRLLPLYQFLLTTLHKLYLQKQCQNLQLHQL